MTAKQPTPIPEGMTRENRPKASAAPPMREYRGLVRVNEYKTVDWYTEKGVLYPNVLVSTRLPTTWFFRLFMNEDQKMLEKSLMKNQMVCTEWSI